VAVANKTLHTLQNQTVQGAIDDLVSRQTIQNKHFNKPAFPSTDYESPSKNINPKKPRILSKLDVKFSPEVIPSPIHVRITTENFNKLNYNDQITVPELILQQKKSETKPQVISLQR